jgi:hypothetical protein
MSSPILEAAELSSNHDSGISLFQTILIWETRRQIFSILSLVRVPSKYAFINITSFLVYKI